jgi:site-specific DNA-methyltransferase (adenine-specific)
MMQAYKILAIQPNQQMTTPDQIEYLNINNIYNIDCLEGMKRIKDKSIDMILCDPPYGCTSNSWDCKLPIMELWDTYNRIIKDDGVIALTAQGSFSAELILSNRKYYRYTLIWQKTHPKGFLNAKRMPLRSHEDILIFYKSLPTYNPQKTKDKPDQHKCRTNGDGKNYGKFDRTNTTLINHGDRYPTSVIKISNGNNKSLHPTQKPVELFEYLIKTYTNEGDTVLDNCMGSGTTAIACINNNRNYIGFENNKCYFDVSINRINDHASSLTNR